MKLAYQMPQTADVADMRKLLLRDLCRIARNICMFRVEHESVLSEPLLVALSDFAEDYERRFKRFLPDCESRFGQTPATGVLTNIVDVNEGIYGVLMLLGAFRAEFEFLSADNEAVARSLVVRSLTHLQRLIVADDTVRRRWKASFTGRLRVKSWGRAICWGTAFGLSRHPLKANELIWSWVPVSR